jgi:hypothetical protein
MQGFQSTRGQWSSVFDWPIIGIHCILTPDGKILTYGTDQLGQQGAQLVYDVWDIAANTHYTLPNTTPTDMFCSAAAVVPETGQILIMGGDSRGHDPNHVNLGVHDANVYDPATMTVSALDPDCEVGEVHGDHICGGHMQFERWYPTAVTLASGKIVVLGGQGGNGVGVGTPELYTPYSGWRTLDGATSDVIRNDWWYPRAWLDADGKINIFEATSTTAQPGKVMLMDPSGDGQVAVVGTVPFETSGANPAIMYEPNKVLALANNGDAWIMDTSGDAPSFTKTTSLNESRLWSNMVVLADGSVMLSGGSGVDNELTNVTNEVAIWNPGTGQWQIGGDAAIPRLYHSTTILLPDATVLSLGGGAPGPVVNTNGEIYSPPYLFDQNGNLAKRPVISTAPDELKPGATFTITVDDASSIDRLTFVKYGAVTHSLNMAASKVELSFTVDQNNKLIAQLPENSNVLTPGNWMLFAINEDGTPSVASTIIIDVGGELLSKQMGGWVTLNGNANNDRATEQFILTQDVQNQKGALMSNERIDLRSDIDISFNIYLGDEDAGADGMAFVLHNDPFGGDATGGDRGSLGASGIRNGLAIEFDTYQNAPFGDITNDHTNFIKTDVPLDQARLSDQVDLGNIEDGKWHKVHVSWDVARQTLSYSFDGKQAGTLTGDLANQYFAGFNYAYFGFTAATGGSSNLQQVEINKFDAVLEDGTQVQFWNGFGQPELTLQSFGADVASGGWTNNDRYPRRLADINGDGMADIVGFGQRGVSVSLATGDGHFAPRTFELAQFGPSAGGWSSQNTYPRQLADVNGDGMADIVGFGQRGVSVSLATGDGHFAPRTFELAQFGPAAGGWSGDNIYPRQLADVDTDGMADIVGFGKAGVFVSLATGDGHFAAPTFELEQFGASAGGWSSNNKYPRQLADVDNDGMADIVGFGRLGVYVSQHDFMLG